MSNMTHYLQFTNSDELFKVPSTAAEVGAAPTGYGYGGTAVPLSTSQILTEEALTTSLNTMYSSMVDKETKLVYFYGFPSLGSGGKVSDYSFFGFLFRGSTNYGSFIAYSAYNGGCTITKTRYAGSWKALEWTNPPMLYDVEYRTTESWNGRPVYRKILTKEYTTSLTKGDHNISHGITNFWTPIQCNAFKRGGHNNTSGIIIPYLAQQNSNGNITGGACVTAINATNITLRIINDTYSQGMWYFDLKYTKSGDDSSV